MNALVQYHVTLFFKRIQDEYKLDINDIKREWTKRVELYYLTA